MVPLAWHDDSANQRTREYPGATDRGAKKDDTENFIKFSETLNKMFKKSPRGGYGLSFTVPSSYWYLRWFDVPKMLDAGADWVNLMSYDLHGNISTSSFLHRGRAPPNR